MKFDELFTLELGVAFRKHRVEAESAGVPHDLDGALADRLLQAIPFEPTDAQLRAMREVGTAMARPHPMNVLLQGDVGAGKTLVALHAALVAIDSGHQAAIMAPTEVLAGQHFRSVHACSVAWEECRTSSSPPPDRPPPPVGRRRCSRRSTGRRSTDDGEPAVTYALLTGAVTGKDRQRIVEAWPTAASTSWSAPTPSCRRA